MNKIKIAILEDNKFLLKDLKRDFERTGLVEVVAGATNSSEFIGKVNSEKPDAIVVDIELPGDSMNGIDVANMLQLPVLIVSGNTAEYFERTFELELNPNIIVRYLPKSVTQNKIDAIVPKFVGDVNVFKNKRRVRLPISGEGLQMIDTDSIVYLTTKGESSGNSVVYFNNRTPGILINYPLKKVEEWDTGKVFLKISGSERVNKKGARYLPPAELEVSCIDNGGKEIKRVLHISEGFQPEIRKAFR